MINRKTLALGGLLVIVALVAGLYIRYMDALESPRGPQAVAEAANSDTAGNATRARDSNAPKPISPRVVDKATGIQAGDPRYKNETDAGLAWLRRNGYPSSLEVEMTSGIVPSLDSIDPKDGLSAVELLNLEQLASSKNDDVRNSAVQTLNEAAAMGSMYALEALGQVYASGPYANKIWSEAYYRAAQIRGNWAVEFRFKPAMNDAENVLAAIMAQQVIDNANRLRQSRGLRPLEHDSRPGAQEALAALRAHLTSQENKGYKP